METMEKKKSIKEEKLPKPVKRTKAEQEAYEAQQVESFMGMARAIVNSRKK